MNENTKPLQTMRDLGMHRRNGALAIVLGELLVEANEQLAAVRTHRTAAWSMGRAADASVWPFVIRTPIGPPYEYDGLEVLTGAALAERYRQAQVDCVDFFPQVWAWTHWHLVPVRIRWDGPGLEPDTSITREGWVSIGDTRIARLTYLVAEAIR
jgi:hypothetical protein